MDYIFFIHSINFVHKSLHYWTGDCFKNNRRSLLMKTKSRINLFATAILATATISAVNVATHPSNAFASEVTQSPNKYNIGTRTTFETDPVFKNFEDGEKYLNNYVKPTITNSRYGAFQASVVPDGLGGNYLVSGFIDSHSEDEEVIKGNKETAQKIVDNASKPMPISESVKPADEVKPVTPAKPAEDTKPVTSAKPTEDVKPETPTKPVEDVKPVTPAKPVEDVKPVTPAKPVEDVKPETPTKPVEEVKPETPAKPIEDVKPVTPTKPVGDKKPVTPAKPVEDKKPETPAKPVEDKKPETPAKPVEEVKSVTPAKPVEEVKPVTPTKPVEEVKPETPAKPENNKNNDKKTLPNTGESTSILGIIGSVLSITGLGFIVKRKRG